ncbi:hypothetical protein Tco_1007492, partial [Tanacetum coccineum]
RAKCYLLLNNICEVFNRQLVDGRDQPIITYLEYIREYLMKRLVVVQKVITNTDGPLTPTVTVIFDVIKSATSEYNVEWNRGSLYQVNGPWMDQCVVDMDIKACSLGIGRTPKKRKESDDELASQSCLLVKISRKGKSVKCGLYGNLGHNRKGCRGQGGVNQVVGFSQQSAAPSQAAGARNGSSQVVGARNGSSQAVGSSQQSGAPSQVVGIKPSATPSQASCSQPNAAPSQSSQGPSQQSA